MSTVKPERNANKVLEKTPDPDSENHSGQETSPSSEITSFLDSDKGDRHDSDLIGPSTHHQCVPNTDGSREGASPVGPSSDLLLAAEGPSDLIGPNTHHQCEPNTDGSTEGESPVGPSSDPLLAAEGPSNLIGPNTHHQCEPKTDGSTEGASAVGPSSDPLLAAEGSSNLIGPNTHHQCEPNTDGSTEGASPVGPSSDPLLAAEGPSDLIGPNTHHQCEPNTDGSTEDASAVGPSSDPLLAAEGPSNLIGPNTHHQCDELNTNGSRGLCTASNSSEDDAPLAVSFGRKCPSQNHDETYDQYDQEDNAVQLARVAQCYRMINYYLLLHYLLSESQRRDCEQEAYDDNETWMRIYYQQNQRLQTIRKENVQLRKKNKALSEQLRRRQIENQELSEGNTVASTIEAQQTIYQLWLHLLLMVLWLRDLQRQMTLAYILVVLELLSLYFLLIVSWLF